MNEDKPRSKILERWHTTLYRNVPIPNSGIQHWWELKNCTLRDVHIDVPSTGRHLILGSSCGLRLIGAAGWLVERVWIEHTDAAMWPSGSNGMVRDCRISNPGEGELPPGEGELPPGEDELPPGEDELPPGEDDVPPGEGELPPGEGELPPSEDDVPPGEGDVPPVGGASEGWAGALAGKLNDKNAGS